MLFVSSLGLSFSLYCSTPQCMCVYARIRFLKMLFSLSVLSIQEEENQLNATHFFFFSSFVYCISSESSMFANCNEVGFCLRNKFEMRVRGAVTYTITSLQRFFNQLHADMSTNHSK